MDHPRALPGRMRRWRAWRRQASRWSRRVDFYPKLELGVAALTILLGVSTYAVLTGQRAPAANVPPTLVTVLLVANLLPLMALIVLIARRLAILFAKRREGQAGAHLHVRLVALFSAASVVPTLLVVVFASLLFQFGVQFWFSDRAKTVLENADRVARAYVVENKSRLVEDIVAMGRDVQGYAADFGIDTKNFADGLAFQVAARNLSEAAVFAAGPRGLTPIATVGIDPATLDKRLAKRNLLPTRAGEARVIAASGDRVEAVVRIDARLPRFMYVARAVDPRVLNQVARTQNALSEYKALIERSRALQWRFNVILMVLSLVILAVAIWFALWLANRLVTPIGALVGATERVGAGDLNARVPVRGASDEIGTLARAFNRMTGQLKAQQTALVGANEQLDRRRQFTEAVLSGVSAGVLSIDPGGHIRLANDSAAQLLQSRPADLAGVPLVDAVPELGELLDKAAAEGTASGQIRIARGAETQTLAVRIAAEPGAQRSYVVTFDDISQQLADQRSAAWSDVARRIAHEIKNPLTPIQLSAERLQRKYGAKIREDPETFQQLTGTIVRQVGDLRRMVDEFSSFARMPKPVFRPEPVLDIARQALFLQEVAHPQIAFALTVPDTLPLLTCDRRQISQALTNLLKNAAEAIETRMEREPGAVGQVTLDVAAGRRELVVTVTDNGIGLPAEHRDRLTEPYVTTRARGTGLGLAIVKKIVEEHDGILELADNPGGGSIARLRFDLAALAEHDAATPDPEPARQQQG